MAKYKPVAATRPPTWIRVQTDDGQFDHRADLPLKEGAEVVADYPEHIGETARPPKAKADLKVDHQRLKDLAKSLDIPVGSKSAGELATAIAEAQAEQAATQPATEAEAAQTDAESESTNNASGAGEGSE